MGYLEKYDDASMTRWLNTQILKDETVLGSVYGFHRNVGSFMSNGMFVGYLAITDMGRVLCHYTDITGANDTWLNLNKATKIKVKRVFLGQLSIYIESKEDKKKYRLKFKTPKAMQQKYFIDHEGNVNNIEKILMAKQSELENK